MIKEAFVVHEACPVGEVAAVPHESCSRRDGGGTACSLALLPLRPLLVSCLVALLTGDKRKSRHQVEKSPLAKLGPGP